ncbi:MAG TPA: hypothetical protein VFS40_08270 [Gemmatimonadales bacterium]|nr:hypothetical protein [Gemmatimonadales bacterium]
MPDAVTLAAPTCCPETLASSAAPATGAGLVGRMRVLTRSWWRAWMRHAGDPAAWSGR